MNARLVYNTTSGRISKTLRENHALAEAQHALDRYETNKAFIRIEGSQILWLVKRGRTGHVMAGTIIRKRPEVVHIPVKFIN